MARRTRQRLTDMEVRRAKPKAKAYRLADGAGLFLFVPPSGVMAWQYRYRHDGRPQTATLGKLADVSLAQARTAAAQARQTAAAGDQLTVAKRVRKARTATATASTFKGVAAGWTAYRARREKWTPDYKDEVTASLRNHLSDLDALPIGEITAAITAPLIERVEGKAPDMARKVEQRLLAIMDYAVRRGQIGINPLPRPERKRRGADDRRHLPAVLDHAAVGAILRAAAVAEVCRGVRRAHLLAVFTAQRVGEIVGAEWSEFDLTAGTWSIPRPRMKRKEADRGPHEVPVPSGLLALLQEWRRDDGDSAVYVCPAPNREGPVTREAVEKFYRRALNLSGKHSPHSWRSVFSSWANDAGKDSASVEAQLDHATGNKVAQSYNRAGRLEIRRPLLAWYESALHAARDGAQVVHGRFGEAR